MNLRLFQVLLQNNWGIWVVGVRAAKFAPRFEKSRSSHSVMLFTSHANFLWLSSPFLKRRENNLLIFEPWLQVSADVDNKKRKRNFLWVKRYACLPVPCVCVCPPLLLNFAVCWETQNCLLGFCDFGDCNLMQWANKCAQIVKISIYLVTNVFDNKQTTLINGTVHYWLFTNASGRNRSNKILTCQKNILYLMLRMPQWLDTRYHIESALTLS